MIEILLQPLPELHGELIEGIVAGQQVIRADDRRVAADIARPDIALLQHRDIGDAEFLGEIIGRRQTMAATADDDHVVMGLRIWLAPLRRPTPVAPERLAKYRKCRKTHVGPVLDAAAT